MAGYNSNLKELKEHLDQDETIHVSCFGAYETKILGSNSARNGVFAATNKRIIFFAKKMFGFGFDLETLPLSKVSTIEFSKNLFGKSINLTMSGNSAKMKWINRGEPEALVNYVRENMGEKAVTVSSSSLFSSSSSFSTSSSSSEDILSQIAKLAELKDQGVITEEEFLLKKTELLSKM